MTVTHDHQALPHSDIKSDSFIDRHVPARFVPYLKLARIDRPVGIWLLLLPGWWAIVLAPGAGPLSPRFDSYHWLLLALFALGSVLMRAAGCVINDLWDKNIDAAVERTKPRPLASGALSMRQALAFLVLLLALSLAILLSMNHLTIMLGVFSLLPVALYPLMKRVTWWPQAFLGLTFNWSALMGWSAVQGHLPPAAFLLYAGAFFWTLAYDTVYAHQDKEDDARIGIKSTARLFGDKSRLWVGGFYAASFVLLFFAKMLANPSFLTPMLMLPLAVAVLIRLSRWNMDDPADCLRLFKANIGLGLALFAVFCL